LHKNLFISELYKIFDFFYKGAQATQMPECCWQVVMY